MIYTFIRLPFYSFRINSNPDNFLVSLLKYSVANSSPTDFNLLFAENNCHLKKDQTYAYMSVHLKGLKEILAILYPRRTAIIR